MIRTLLTAAAATALLAGAAHAQDASAQERTPAQTHSDMSAPLAPDTAVNPPADSMAAPPPAAGSETTGPASPDAVAAGVPASATVTTATVTNGPVADTPENRAKYAPLSHAGKRSKAAGN
jgi:hypothetical protein